MPVFPLHIHAYISFVLHIFYAIANVFLKYVSETYINTFYDLVLYYY